MYSGLPLIQSDTTAWFSRYCSFLLQALCQSDTAEARLGSLALVTHACFDIEVIVRGMRAYPIACRL
jgi:hypothetical protein